ncbi:tape measure protein [Spirosoma sordidisoli]|nr:tape measure protein [Spirosoma sordidisoli]
MQKRLATLSAEYAKLDLSQKADVKRKKEIERELTQTTRAYNSLIRVTNTATKATESAERSYDRLNQETKQLRAQLRALDNVFETNTLKINNNNKAAAELLARIQANDRALRQLDAQMGIQTRSSSNYGTSLKNVASNALLTAGSLIGITSALDAVQMGLGIIADMERVNSALKAVSKDSADFQQTQKFLLTTANDLGLRYDVLAKSYKGLKAATNNTALEGKATQQIFSGLVRSGAALKLSNEEIEGAIKAVEQMMSKGKVTAEELRGQLAERLPGAMRLLAEATGLSEVELNKMMEKGELLAVNVLPQLADQLDKTYGKDAQNNLASMAGGWNVLTNEVHLFLAALNDDGAIDRTATNITGMIADTLRGMRAAVRSSDWKTFFGALASYTGMGMVIPGIGDEAVKQVGRNSRNEKVVNQYQSMSIDQRKARREITQDAIARDENLLNTTYKDSIFGGNKSKVEDRIKENKQLLEKLNKAEKDVRRQQRKDNEQEEINAQRKAATNKAAEAERQAKEAKARAAARTKAEVEADRQLSESLSVSKANTGNQLAGLSNDKQDGLLSEQDFIEQRQKITLAGIAERQGLLIKAGKKETDDYKKLLAEKLEAETQYKRDLLKIRLADSRQSTANALGQLSADKEDGTVSEAEFVERRNAITVGGIQDRQRILEEAGLQESKLYRDAESEILDASADYYKDRLKIAKAGWKAELAELNDAFKEIDGETAANYQDQLVELQRFYDKRRAEVQKNVNNGRISESEGKAQLAGIDLDQLRDEITALGFFYEQDRQLSEQATAEKINHLEEWKETGIKTAAEMLEADRQIAAIKKAREEEAAKDKKRLDKEVADNAISQSKRKTDKEIANDEKVATKRKQLTDFALQLTQVVGDGLFDAEKQRTQNKITALEKQKEAELQAVGGNESAKAAIERKYDEQRKRLMRQQDIQTRQKAIFDIILAAAVNIAKNPALALFTGGLALAQIAIVQSQPLPAYKDGRGAGDTYEGPALAGEAGKELLVRDNKASLIDKPSILNVKKGDIIYPNHITERLLRGEYREGSQIMERSRVAGQTVAQLSQGRDAYQAKLIASAFHAGPTAGAIGKAVGDAIAKHPKFHLTFDRNGFNVSQHDANTRIIQQRNKHQLGK